MSTEQTQIRGITQFLNVPLEICKQVLNNGKRKHTEEEVRQIRELLYMLAELQLENEKEN